MKHLCVAILAIVVLSGGARVDAQSGYDLFQKALATERADGNLREAIQIYERVVKQFAGDRTLVARSLVRIAECQEKLGQRDATKVYERIVRDFADQAESAAVARARLSALQGPAIRAMHAVKKIWEGGDVDAMGSPSADGRFLSYTHWTTGDLAIRDLAEGTSRMVTNTGGWDKSGDYAEASLLSPDARQIAFAWFVDKGGDPTAKCVCRYELRVIPLAGPDAGKPRTLLRGDSASFWVQPSAWTPDGKGLLFVRATTTNTHEIAMLTLADNTVRVIKTVGAQPPSRVTLSADGRFAALDVASSPDAPARDIVIVNVADRTEIAVVQDPAHDYSPAFSVDGAHLLFLSDRTGTNSLWRLPMTGGRPAGSPVLAAAVAPNAILLGATRSGTAYYWTGGPNSNIYNVDLDATMTTSGAPRIGVERFLNTNTSPVFSPDGLQLAYQSRRGTGQGNSGTVIVVHNLANKRDREIPLNTHVSGAVSWFPDNRSLLVAIRDQQGNRLHYHRLDVVTGEHRLVMSTKAIGIPIARPQVSTDGKAIYFVDRLASEGPVQWVLARYDIATGATTELRTPAGGNAFTSFQLSPDGTEVAYLVTDNDARRSILEIMPSGGGPSREVFQDRALGQSRYSGLAWSRDKRHILMARANDLGQPGGQPGGSFWRIPVAGGAPEPTGIAMPGMVRFPTLDPNGARLMFVAAGGAEPAIWAVENFLPRK